MKLILTQPEIEAILRAHVNSTVQLTSGSDYTIEFTATRSDSGMTATIDIPYMGVSSIPAIVSAGQAPAPAETTPAVITPDTPVRRGPGRPKGSGNVTNLLTGGTAAPATTPAANLLGGGTTPATGSILNPTPVEEAPAEAEEPEQEEAQEATETAQEAAPAETQAEPAPEAQPAPKRGPSLFGN
jgi:hypothetical protein